MTNMIDILEFEKYDQTQLETDYRINFQRSYQQCSLSVMDTIADPKIYFDEEGVCNYHHEYLLAAKEGLILGEAGRDYLNRVFRKIKENGRDKKYDCILGLSGGVDSTYLCLLAKEYGLRPLVVHCDNGWNSELAQFNIEHTIRTLDFDLYTYVINWKEFRELQLSYLRASVVDIEVLTDHAFMAVLYKQARKWKIKYVLAGMNIVTEQVLPSYWIYSKADAVNIRAIHEKYGRIPLNALRSFPFLDYATRRYCNSILKMQIVTPLNYLRYNYSEIKERLKTKLNWRDYGGKHYESVWTRFYQGFILPNKFKIDKRKAHLSNLIFSGQMTKEQAVEKLSEPIYDEKLQRQDLEFVLKKFDLTPKEFSKILQLPRREHRDFETLKGFYEIYPILKSLRPLIKLIKGN